MKGQGDMSSVSAVLAAGTVLLFIGMWVGFSFSAALLAMAAECFALVLAVIVEQKWNEYLRVKNVKFYK